MARAGGRVKARTRRGREDCRLPALNVCHHERRAGPDDDAGDVIRAMRNAMSATLVSIALVSFPPMVGAEWTITMTPAPGSGCILESSPESLSDGYQTTTARIRIDGK